MALVEQLVTVGAVMAGAAGSYLTTRLADRDRFKRDLKVRWDERRLDAYAVYVTAVKRVQRCSWLLLSAYFDGDARDDREAQLAEMRTAEAERSRAFEQVMLLGDGDTIGAAHELNQRLWKLENPARGEGEITRDVWQRRSDDWVAALNDFHTHARRGLGISGDLVRRDVVSLPAPRSRESQ